MQKIFQQKKSFLPLFLFIFFFSAFLVTSGGHGDPFDGPSYFIITEGIAERGTPTMDVNSPAADKMGFDIEQYIEIRTSLQAYQYWYTESHALSPEMTISELITNYPFGTYLKDYRTTVDQEYFYGPGYLLLPILATPIYVVADFFNVSVIDSVFLLFNTLVLTFTCIILYFISRNLFSSERIAVSTAIIFGLTSFIWPYITSLYSNPLALMFMVFSIYLILLQKNKISIVLPLLTSASIGAMILAHPQFIMFAPFIFIYSLFELRKKKRNLIFFIIGILLMSSLQAYINYDRYGDPLNFLGWQNAPEHDTSEPRSIEGLYGFLFSSGKSLFLYFPLAILIPFGFYYLFQKNKSLTILLGTIFLLNYFFTAIHPAWYGISYWGPHRHFLPLVPIIAICMGSLIARFSSSIRWKIGIVSLGISGFIVNLLGNLVWIQYAYAYGWGPEGLWKIEDKDFVFTWNPYHSPVFQTIKVLQSDWVSTLPINPERLDYFRIGLNGCTYDLFLYCEFGLLPILVLCSIIAISGYIILKILLNLKQKITFPDSQ